jgi:protein TonB
VSRLLRWLPLSIAAHVAALGGAVWLVDRVLEPALFVDLTLAESQRDVASAPSIAPPSRGGAAGTEPRPSRTERRSATRQLRSSSPPATEARPAPAATPATPEPTPEPATAADTPQAPVAAAPSPPSQRTEESAPQAGFAWPATQPDVPSGPASGGQLAAGEGGGATASGALGAGPSGGATSGSSGARGDGAGDGRLALAVPGDTAGAYGPYLAALRRRIQDMLSYPASARRRGIAGTVHLDIVLEATGAVTDVVVVRSSSHAVLDDAAVDAARALRRVPFPPDVRPRALRVRLPVVFELR